MKIRAITPIFVDDEELVRRQDRYNRLSPPGWEIVLENLDATFDPPRQMSSAAQIRSSEVIVAKSAIDTDHSEFDAVLSDCVLDSGVEILERNGGIPVLGITRLSAHFLAACGRRFGVVTRNEAIGDEYSRIIDSFGLTHLFDGVFGLGLEASDISDTHKWNAAIEAASVRAAERGVSLLINGCSAVEVTFTSRNVSIVDPTSLALRVAGLAGELGLLGRAS